MHIQEILNAINANHIYEYMVIDDTLKIIEYSDKAFKLCDVDAVECDNLNLTETVPELYGLEEEIEKIFKKERGTLELPYIVKGPGQYVDIHIHPGRCGGGEQNRYETVIILFENITAQAKMQQNLVQERNEKALLLREISGKNSQLKRFNEEMQTLVEEEIRKNREKQQILEIQSRHAQMGEMIGMITHQWKQPLSVISLIANLLKSRLEVDPLEKELFDKKLDDILMQVRHMDQTVLDFQNFFNPLKEKVFFTLFESIQSVARLIENAYRHKNISLKIKGDKTLSAYGYPNEFNQVLLSLLKNAKDAFMENPRDKMRISITIAQENDFACIRIEDNAGGIDEEVLDTIFDLYVTTKKEGSGLGLNLAKSMIEKNMQGKLEAENTENGARFSIWLPIFS